jgi:hypothetical protein
MKNARSSIWSALLVGVVVGAAALAVTPGVAAADGACGAKENPCPLQKWMRTNIAPANASADMPALAAALDKVAGFAPDASWNAGDPKTTWKGIAQAGAAAARANDAAAVKASCKSCHEGYKDKYKAQFRTKPIPG